MNWLAHLRLAPDDKEVRLGALLCDFARGDELLQMPPRVSLGLAHHRAIDRFTDAHPIFAQSRARIAAPLRRFSGVLVDVFYDHFLARDWQAHGDGRPLREFTAAHYALLDEYATLLPATLRRIAPQMRAYDWLASYETLAGIDDVLQRMDRRLKKSGPIAAGSAELRANYEGLDADFAAFFPQVQSFAKAPLAAT
ncbi:MAG: ACP phosphodiesterase [Planctomycetota bacterium]|jgi:acyl carrier protein phosphodiesterase